MRRALVGRRGGARPSPRAYQVFAGWASLERSLRPSFSTSNGPWGARPRSRRLQAALPFGSEILPAVDGRLLSPEEVRRLMCDGASGRAIRSASACRDRRVPKPSRRLAKILEQRLDFALVFEDDAAIDAMRFAALADFARRRTPDLGLCAHAGGRPRARRGCRRQARRISADKAARAALRAIAQFVSRAAAERLLAVTAPFDRPVDTFLQMNWATGVTLLAATPTPIRDVSPRDRRHDRAAQADGSHRAAAPRDHAADLPRANAGALPARGAEGEVGRVAEPDPHPGARAPVPLRLRGRRGVHSPAPAGEGRQSPG